MEGRLPAHAMLTGRTLWEAGFQPAARLQPERL